MRVTKKSFAWLHGVDKSTVSGWLANGLIDDEGGAIVWDRATKNLAKALDGHALTRRDGEIHDKVMDLLKSYGDFVEPVDEGEVEPITKQQLAEAKKREALAKAKEREEKAIIKTIERRREEGKLVEIAQVKLHIEDVMTRLRQRLETIPNRLAEECFAAPTSRKVYELIDDEVRQTLTDAADNIEKTAATLSGNHAEEDR